MEINQFLHATETLEVIKDKHYYIVLSPNNHMFNSLTVFLERNQLKIIVN